MSNNTKFKSLSGRSFPRFSSLKSFFRLPWVSNDDDFDIGILGVPFDGGTSYRPGARMAPTKIREMSSLARNFNWEINKDYSKKWKVADIGDCPTTPVSLEKTYNQIEKFFTSLDLKQKRFISVGGDHSITLPILRSLAKQHGPLNLIHFDAHIDTYPAAWDCEYHHGSFLRHALDEGLVNGPESLQIGCRNPLTSKNDLEYIEKYKIKSFTMDDIRKNNFQDFLKKLPKVSGNSYITFDIDSIDPAYAPGTGTPVPAGLTSYEAIKILQNLKLENLVGADLVEVAPAYDHSDITSILGVSILFEFLNLM
ncbi:MAG: agmatinase [Bdellovibrionales bacterium]|nr:agmatinase [Bdellovibrionales bacterium]